MSDVPLPEPDISVPFLSEIRKVYQGDYYRADKVLPLLKQWGVLYSAAKAGHEQAHAEAVKSAVENARLREALGALMHALDESDLVHDDQRKAFKEAREVLKGASHE